MDFISFLYTLAPIIADSTDSGGGEAAVFGLFLSGFIFYGAMIARYRNADKRHSHEAETSAKVANLQVADTFVQRRTGLSNSMMSGANQSRIEGAMNQSSTTSKLLKSIMP